MRNFLYFCLILAGCTSTPGEIRETISLAGEWDFRLDSLDIGLAEKWYALSFDEHVNLPGSMAENGKGDEVTLEGMIEDFL